MKSEVCSRAFTDIAPYYDTLMSFINYRGWVTYIENILAFNTIRGKTVLDLACGTGVCMLLWLERGYHVIGLDRSLPMLEVCRQKLIRSAPRVHNNVYLINSDIRNFALARKVPIMTCLYDSLNYLLCEADLVSCFECVYDTLSDDGIFIFDMNTVHCLHDEWGNQTFHRQDGDIYSTWKNTFNTFSFISSLDLTLAIKKNGKETIIKEFHQERAYPLSTIRELLTNAGFDCSFYRHLTFTPAQERDLRVMGVATKK